MATVQIPTMGEPAILIEQARINACSAAHGNVIQPDTLLQMVLAHETSHRFGVLHYYRYAPYAPDIPTPRPFGLVTKNEYARDPLNAQQIYSRLQVYIDAVGTSGAWTLGDLPDQDNYDLAGRTVSNYYTEPPGSEPAAGAADHVMRMTLSAPIGTSFNFIRVYQQQMQMMDFAPRWISALQDPVAWQFDPAHDLDHMCVKCR